jgi:hypothetical protein
MVGDIGGRSGAKKAVCTSSTVGREYDFCLESLLELAGMAYKNLFDAKSRRRVVSSRYVTRARNSKAQMKKSVRNCFENNKVVHS